MIVQTLHQPDWPFGLFYKGGKFCEEMVSKKALPMHTTGAVTCKAVINAYSSRQIDISKVVSVTTDCTRSMTGVKAGFVNLFFRMATQ